MKKFLKIALVAIAFVAMASGTQASAQLRFGVKAGVNINSLHFDNLSSNFSDDNRAGFTGGVMTEFTVPVLGLGFDASVMYVRRSSKWMELNVQDETASRDYITVPINLKWKIGIPAVGNIVTPYLMTGPDFAFLCSKKDVANALEAKSFDCAWNFGLGVELLNHLQVSASYGLGLTKAVETLTSVEGAGIKGKNNYWTVTAAYLF